MASYLLPLETGKPLYTVRYTLDEREWIFKFDWNARAERWLMSIGLSVDGKPQEVAWSITGLPLFCLTDLLQRWRTRPDMPRGALMCLFSGSDNAPPKLDDFGVGLRVELWYFDVEDAIVIANNPTKFSFVSV